MSDRFVVQPREVPAPTPGGTPGPVPALAIGWMPRPPASRAAGRPRHPSLHALAEYLEDPDVTDIFVNGAEGLFVDRGTGPAPQTAWHADEEEVRNLAIALIGLGGRHIDDAKP